MIKGFVMSVNNQGLLSSVREAELRYEVDEKYMDTIIALLGAFSISLIVMAFFWIAIYASIAIFSAIVITALFGDEIIYHSLKIFDERFEDIGAVQG